ncbi:CsbD family protein [Methylobacterium sp. NEAU K]|uniref:CsbD family protein n=1 Tax=Methylobacterium sp. NEAU K TaxID=3064946 RepID=UPI0027344C38|nr:CsbD family protein [Methylobacterium sp. NEAU K]MDP4006232.1 CsbD family protein [Methylobacterium sp. NEAU K]
MTEQGKSTSTEHLKGSVKEAIGKLTGDTRVEAEGRRQKREARPSKPTRPRRD